MKAPFLLFISIISIGKHRYQAFDYRKIRRYNRQTNLIRRIDMALNEIANILLAAGCGESEIEMIVSSIQKGESQKTEKLIAKCRRKQLDKLHESQACIDRLDYLSYQLRKA